MFWLEIQLATKRLTRDILICRTFILPYSVKAEFSQPLDNAEIQKKLVTYD